MTRRLEALSVNRDPHRKERAPAKQRRRTPGEYFRSVEIDQPRPTAVLFARPSVGGPGLILCGASRPLEMAAGSEVKVETAVVTELPHGGYRALGEVAEVDG